MDLVIFDIDGTLIHSHTKEVDAFATAVKAVFGIPEINRDLHCYEHITDSGILKECVYNALKRLPTTSEIQAVEDFYLDHFTNIIAQEPIEPIPGSPNLLETLHAHPNIALAVATGSHYRSALLKLSHVTKQWREISLGSSNDSVVRTTIMETAHHKAKQCYGVKQFERIIYIGDGPWDVKATKQLQWEFIGIASNYAKDELRDWGAKCVIDNYLAPNDFLHLLENENLVL